MELTLNFSNRFNPSEYPTEDCDEVARVQRAREIHEGVDPPPGYRTVCVDPVYVAADPSTDNRLSSCSVEEKESLNALRPIADGPIDSASILNNTDVFPNIMFNSVDPQPRIIHSQVKFSFDFSLLRIRSGITNGIWLSVGGFHSLSCT